MALLELNISATGVEQGAKRAEVALAVVKKGAIEAESAVGKLTSTFTTVGKGAADAAIRMQSVVNATTGVNRQFKSASASAAVFEQAMAREASMAGRLSVAFANVTGATQRFGGALATGLRGAAAAAVSSSRLLVQQLSQVGQQALATGNIVQALSIQLPDIGLAFGSIGAAVGLVAAIALPLLVSAFGSAGEEAKTLDETLDDLSGTVSDYVAVSQAASASSAELAAEYGRLSGAAKAALDAIADARRAAAIDAVSASIKGIGETLLETVQNFGRSGVAGQRLDLIDNFGLARDQARELRDALLELQDAPGLDAQAGAALRFNDLLIQAFGSVANLPPELRAAYEAAAQVTVEAAKIAGETENAALAAGRLTSGVGASVAAYRAAKAEALGLAQATADAAAQFRLTQQQLAAGGKVYSGRGSDPRTSNEKGVGQFVYTGPSLDAFNNPIERAGSGASGAASAIDQVRTAYDNLRASVDEAYASQLQFERAEETVNKALAAGIITKEEAATMLDRLKEKYGETGEAADEAAKQAAGFFTGLITSARSATDIVVGLLERMAQKLIESGLTSIFSGIIAGGGPLASAVQFLFSANGNVFSGGSVVPFAAGGVVYAPTFFPMAGGRAGLMGEAGPEAIMPLKRGADGRLGVEAAPGGKERAPNVGVFLDQGLFESFIRQPRGRAVIIRTLEEAGFQRA